METFAWLLVAVPLLSYALAVLVLWLGIPIGGFIFPMAVCGAVLWVCVDKEVSPHVRWWSIFAVVAVLCITIMSSVFIYDASYDGQWYHAGTIRGLVNHWNPMYDTVVGCGIDGVTALWVEHYPRGIETIAATIVACVGSLEAGKALNLWFVIASIVYVYLFLQDYLPSRSRYLRLWIALLVALNPVVVTQLFTYYIDWSLYTLLIIFLINFYLFFEKGVRRSLYLNLLLLFFVSAIKMNITFWILLWGGICFFVEMRKSRYGRPYRLTALCVVVALAGVVSGTYNPYLTNWQEHDTPFYPLVGREKVDIMENQQLLVIQGKSNFEAVLMSLVSNPQNNLQADSIEIWGVSKNSLIYSATVDTRLGGFGLFFFEAILLSIVLFISTGQKHRMTGYLWVLGGLFVSLFLLPSGWWSRYVAFFYLFPFVLLFYAERYGLSNRFTRALHIMVLVLLSVDVLICVGGRTVKNIVYKETVDYVLDRMEASGQEVELNTRNYLFLDKLNHREIPYKIVPHQILKERLFISLPLYLNRAEFDFETGQPWILSLRHVSQMNWEPNPMYGESH